MTEGTYSCRECRTEYPYSVLSFRGLTVPAPSICPRCAQAAEDAEGAQASADELAARNIPPRYQGATFATFIPATGEQEQALAAVRDEAASGVLLMGRAGCGKTHLAAAAIIAGPVGSLFAPTTQLLDDIRAGYDGAGRGLYERSLTAPLLALDDLGAEAVTDWVRDRLYSLLNERWNRCLPAIVTTNCSPRVIAERIGDGAASRLAGMCARRIEVKGIDLRRSA